MTILKGTPAHPDYPGFLAELKDRILQARTTAVRAVNRELILLYWDIGRGIVEKNFLSLVVRESEDDRKSPLILRHALAEVPAKASHCRNPKPNRPQPMLPYFCHNVWQKSPGASIC
ncbi:MAG: hypothetical protein R6X19_03590 [Kiritimatiellia bacterium]